MDQERPLHCRLPELQAFHSSTQCCQSCLCFKGRGRNTLRCPWLEPCMSGSRFHHVAFRKPMYYSWQNPPPIIDIHIIPNIKELPKPCTCVFSRLKKDVTEGWVAGELGNHSAMGNPFYRNSMDGEQSKAKGRRSSVVPSLRVTKSMSPHYCSFFSWVQLHTIAGIEMHRD